MKRKFEERRFTEAQLNLIEFCNAVINNFVAQGYDLSLRQLYYQCVSRNVLPNRPESYTMLGKLIGFARMAGLVDWDHIVDRGRPLHKSTLWSGPGNMIKQLAKTFKYDRWKNQPFFLEVMVEKQALEGVLLPVCNRLGIGFSANKGYSSASALYEASLRYNKAFARGKEVCVFYLGDHDPSGVDMTRDIRERLKVFCGREVDVKRLSLNKSQIEEHDLPPNPAKLSDSRSGKYVERHGDSSWELDALPPNVLANYVLAAVNRRLDHDQWKKDLALEAKMRAHLEGAAKALNEIYAEPVEKQVIPDDNDNDNENGNNGQQP